MELTNSSRGATAAAQGNLILRLRKKPDGRYVEEGRLVEWVDNVDNPIQVRVPISTEATYLLSHGLFVGGQPYASLGELQYRWEGEHFFRDRYGHRVLEVRERFPCFDSCDYENEHRYTRWFYLVFGDKLWCISYRDTEDSVIVTEDVGEIPASVWRAMHRMHVVNDVEIEAFPLV